MVSEELKAICQALEQEVQAHNTALTEIDRKIEDARHGIEAANKEMIEAAGRDDSKAYEEALRRRDFLKASLAYSEDRKAALPKYAISDRQVEEVNARLTKERDRLTNEEQDRLRDAWLKLVEIHESYEPNNKVIYKIVMLLNQESSGKVIFATNLSGIPETIHEARDVLRGCLKL